MDTAQPGGNVATVYSCANKEFTEQAERVLLALVSAGDRCAMDNLYGVYFTRLANFFRHLTARADLVEELINDTMVEVWRERRTIGANASASVTIMGLAYTRAQKRLAEASAGRSPLQPARPAADHVQSNPLDFLLKLPVEERAVLHLIYSGGHSRREIAEIMHISCQCVDALLCDARLRCGVHIRTVTRN
jgi:DNA-directed RNA polymerase specialized sigma24 family protein